MSTIGWVIDHNLKKVLFCASLTELCLMKLSLNLLVLNTGLNFRCPPKLKLYIQMSGKSFFSL